MKTKKQKRLEAIERAREVYRSRTTSLYRDGVKSRFTEKYPTEDSYLNQFRTKDERRAQ